MGAENDADEFSDRDEIMLNALSAGLTLPRRVAWLG